jgi:hypothetical protein
VELKNGLQLKGHVRIRGHKPDYQYSRDNYQHGDLTHDDHNAIQSTGIDYICRMLLADAANEGAGQPRRYGITQMGVLDTGDVERAKLDVTDQYVSGSSIVNVLYLTSAQPAGQPHNLNQARLYLDTAGATLLAIAFHSSYNKNSLIAVTYEWTLTLTGA